MRIYPLPLFAGLLLALAGIASAAAAPQLLLALGIPASPIDVYRQHLQQLFVADAFALLLSSALIAGSISRN